jgi:hypothetical protein
MALIDMKLTAKEAKAEVACCPSEDSGPAYPYGLSLNLDDEVLAKLGLTEMPAVGAKMMLMAEVEVTGTSQYSNQDGKEGNVNLQITAMELNPSDKPSAAERLYGKK